ncbi:hypothetical protein MalM25_06520 [Planctomycetes bacterium MalM25]|nr:hypothetical protein MalM25_06520 [Planctomycetes bacterium MalM25]
MSEPVLVVSGLPRSGTSLVMQMLATGGVEPLTDGERAADIDNPRGYLELEAVKRMKGGAEWIPDARGKVVKVISHLLGDLPAGEDYRVVFVERDLDEVLASQAKMIERLGRPAPPEEAVRRAFEAHLQNFDQLAQGFEVLRLRYVEIIAEPAEAARKLADFAGVDRSEPLDLEAMQRVVEPALYRNRRSG